MAVSFECTILNELPEGTAVKKNQTIQINRKACDRCALLHSVLLMLTMQVLELWVVQTMPEGLRKQDSEQRHSQQRVIL